MHPLYLRPLVPHGRLSVQLPFMRTRGEKSFCARHGALARFTDTNALTYAHSARSRRVERVFSFVRWIGVYIGAQGPETIQRSGVN